MPNNRFELDAAKRHAAPWVRQFSFDSHRAFGGNQFGCYGDAELN